MTDTPIDPKSFDQQMFDIEKKLKQLEMRAQHIQKLINSDGSEPIKGGDKKKEKKPENPNARQQPPKQPKGQGQDVPAGVSKAGYIYDGEAVAARYNHDLFMPRTLLDPSTGYTNALTNTDADIEKAHNVNEKRMREIVRTLGLQSAVFFRAPFDYYDWPLLKRRDLLGAPSVHYLCKSMLMKNSKCPHDKFDNRLDSKYYCCVVQYSARLHNEKVGHAIRRLHDEPKPPQKKFNFRWVDGETNDLLTGQPRNGVTPIGAKENVPIIISHKIASLPYAYMWIGGGEVDLKLRLSVAEFIKHYNCIVDDITYDDEVENDDGPCGRNAEEKSE